MHLISLGIRVVIPAPCGSDDRQRPPAFPPKASPPDRQAAAAARYQGPQDKKTKSAAAMGGKLKSFLTMLWVMVFAVRPSGGRLRCRGE